MIKINPDVGNCILSRIIVKAHLRADPDRVNYNDLA